MALPDEIKEYPMAFSDIAERVNALIAFGKTVELMEGKGGIKVSVSDRRITIDGSAPPDDTGGGTGGGGGGLPSGYGPESWTVYDGGVVTTRNFLTNNPD